MKRALIICDAPKVAEVYDAFLKKNGFEQNAVCRGGQEAKRKLADYDFELCIINAPLKAGRSANVAIEIAQQNACQVLLFAKEDRYDEMLEATEQYGVIVVAKPVSSQTFWRMLKLAESINARMGSAHREIKKLKSKLEETKLVSRAKCVLIEKKQITEEEAHRYIEKQAMDRRVSRKSVAVDILDFYEDR